MACLCRGERVPRRAPQTVVEQRVTLGTYERAQLDGIRTLVKRQQNIDAATAAAMPVALVAVGLTGVFVVANTWQKVNDLIPSFDGFLNGLSNVIHGDEETKQAIIRDAEEQAQQDGKPLTFWQKARNRFAFDAFRFGGGVY